MVEKKALIMTSHHFERVFFFGGGGGGGGRGSLIERFSNISVTNIYTGKVNEQSILNL